MFEHLRNKSIHVRDRYAFLGAFVITGLIAGIWLLSLPIRFGNTQHAQVNQDVEIDGAFKRMLSDTKARVSDIWENARGGGSVTYTATTTTENPVAEGSVEEIWQQTLEEVKHGHPEDGTSETRATTTPLKPILIGTSTGSGR